MRNQFKTWIIILAALVFVLLVLNLQTAQDTVGVTPLLSGDARNARALGEYALRQYDDRGWKAETVNAVKPPAGPSPVKPAVIKTPPPVKVIPAPKAETGKGDFTIQSLSFRNKTTADAELQQAVAAGLPAYLATVDQGAKGVLYRLCIGSFATKAAAEQFLPKAKKKYPGSFIVMRKK